ncbi:uncharacterized protein AB675_4266 [Cyphellophora attinorum]|uniref:Uncharacterized protein n=1 Tax=Cyphellophora attinorum TaxID=1664694 RepID=A0A0N1H253_9EURO|nr:uncharacterized protein AB675_4266 [Phialophora attinorum]KPI38650.1 hypothetical protein AB675_4266 [Phialophora attinorum]
MFAGAAGAVAAGGAAALYSQRDKISAGWTWASDHLLFIGDLARAENLRRRVEMLEKATGERGAKCMNLYTNLGKGRKEGTVTGHAGRRTFVNLPAKVGTSSSSTVSSAKGKSGEATKAGGMAWHEAVNDKAADEIAAHCSMFTPKDNPNFYALGERAKACIVDSVDQAWYAGSEKKKCNDHEMDLEGSAALGDGEAWEKADGAKLPADELVDEPTEDDEVKMTNSYEGSKKDRLSLNRNGDGGGVDDNDEELEDSIIVEKAAHKEAVGDRVQYPATIPLPDENPWSR